MIFFKGLDPLTGWKPAITEVFRPNVPKPGQTFKVQNTRAVSVQFTLPWTRLRENSKNKNKSGKPKQQSASAITRWPRTGTVFVVFFYVSLLNKSNGPFWELIWNCEISCLRNAGSVRRVNGRRVCCFFFVIIEIFLNKWWEM